MNEGVLQFALGLNTSGFDQALSGSRSSLKAFTGQTALSGEGIRHFREETIDTREKVEIFRNSLENLGGRFGSIAEYARLFFNPLTLGFAAAFSGAELFKRALEEDGEAMRGFIDKAEKVNDILRGIIAARPQDLDVWVESLEAMSKAVEKLDAIKNLGDAFNSVLEGVDQNNADAANERLELEQKRIDLLKESGRISEAEAARRTEALKDQLVLQQNLNERTKLQNEIKRREGELNHVRSIAAQIPGQGEAAIQKNAADAKVADLKRQLDEIPKAIAANENLINVANANARITKNVPKKMDWYNQADDLTSRNNFLKEQMGRVIAELPTAVKSASDANTKLGNASGYKERVNELNGVITGLKNQLGVTVDRQNKLTPLKMEENRLDALKFDAFKSIFSEKSMYKPDFTQLNKMGFVQGGANGSDVARQTADNTRQMVGLLGTAVNLLSNGDGQTNSI